MNQAEVVVQCPKRHGPLTTDSRHGYAVAPTLLARQFDVAKPDHVWVGDIRDVWTAEGWWYASTLLDRYARKVMGRALSSRIDTTVVQDTWRMALGRRHPVAGLLHHADRGSQQDSHAYQDMLADHGIVCRTSRKGECLDHAVAERFFGSLTREWTAHRDDATRPEARGDMIACIKMFYYSRYSRRKHSCLGYVSRNEYEKLACVA
jgi:putative transposase